MRHGQAAPLCEELPLLQWRLPNLLGDGLSCPGPFLNDCFCPTRTDLAPVATRSLSSCITGPCTQGEPGPDFTFAWNLYGTYCLTNGYSVPGFRGVAAAATATGGDSSAPTITQVTIVTETIASGSSTLLVTLTGSEFLLFVLLLGISATWMMAWQVCLGNTFSSHSSIERGPN